MKKLVVVILAFLYLISSAGATVHLHYCMDNLVSWGFADRQQHSADNGCSHCGMKKEDSKGCCKDEHKQVKIHDDQKSTVQSFYETPFSSGPEIISTVTYEFALPTSLALSYPVSHAPPAETGTAVYILNCDFRI